MSNPYLSGSEDDDIFAGDSNPSGDNGGSPTWNLNGDVPDYVKESLTRFAREQGFSGINGLITAVGGSGGFGRAALDPINLAVDLMRSLYDWMNALTVEVLDSYEYTCYGDGLVSDESANIMLQKICHNICTFDLTHLHIRSFKAVLSEVFEEKRSVANSDAVVQFDRLMHFCRVHMSIMNNRVELERAAHYNAYVKFCATYSFAPYTHRMDRLHEIIHGDLSNSDPEEIAAITMKSSDHIHRLVADAKLA
jgi:hypothetical protein